MSTVIAGAPEPRVVRLPSKPAWWESGDVVRKVGMWAAFTTAVMLAAGTLTYVLEGRWPGIAAYVADFSNVDLMPWVFFALIAVFFAITVTSIHALTPERSRFLSLSGLGFTLAYATICISTCVLQFTYVRYRISGGSVAGLEPWVSASPKSAMFALDNLAFLLQGIATLFLAPLFRGSWLADSIRRLFVLNGVGVFGLILLASFMGFETSFRHALYLGTTVAWAVILGTALVLVAVAFQRRVLSAETAPTE